MSETDEASKPPPEPIQAFLNNLTKYDEETSTGPPNSGRESAQPSNLLAVLNGTRDSNTTIAETSAQNSSPVPRASSSSSNLSSSQMLLKLINTGADTSSKPDQSPIVASAQSLTQVSAASPTISPSSSTPTPTPSDHLKALLSNTNRRTSSTGDLSAFLPPRSEPDRAFTIGSSKQAEFNDLDSDSKEANASFPLPQAPSSETSATSLFNHVTPFDILTDLEDSPSTIEQPTEEIYRSSPQTVIFPTPYQSDEPSPEPAQLAESSIIIDSKRPLSTTTIASTMENITISYMPTNLIFKPGKAVAVHQELICYGMKGGKLRIIRESDGTRLLLLQHTAAVTDIAFWKLRNPGSKKNTSVSMLTMGEDSQIACWNFPQTEAKSETIPYKKYFSIVGTPKSSSSSRYRCIACHPSCKYVFAVGTDSSQILVFNMMSINQVDFKEKEVANVITLTGHQTPVNIMNFSPSGDVLASGDNSGVVKLWRWNSEPDQLIHNLRPCGSDPVTWLHFIEYNTFSSGHSSSDEYGCSFLLTASDENTKLNLVQLETQNTTHSLSFGTQKNSSNPRFNVLCYDDINKRLFIGCNSRDSLITVDIDFKRSDKANATLSLNLLLNIPSSSSKVDKETRALFTRYTEVSCSEGFFSLDVNLLDEYSAKDHHTHSKSPSKKEQYTVYGVFRKSVHMYSSVQNNPDSEPPTSGETFQSQSSKQPSKKSNFKETVSSNKQSIKEAQPSGHIPMPNAQEIEENISRLIQPSNSEAISEDKVRVQRYEASETLAFSADPGNYSENVPKPDAQLIKRMQKCIQQTLEEDQALRKEQFNQISRRLNQQQELLKRHTHLVENIAREENNSTISNEMYSVIDKVVEKAIQRMISQKGAEGLNKALRNNEVQKCLQHAIKGEMRHAFQDQKFMEEIADLISQKTMHNLQETIQKNFRDILVPAYQQASHSMFQQLHLTFEQGIQQFLKEIEKKTATYNAAFTPAQSQSHILTQSPNKASTPPQPQSQTQTQTQLRTQSHQAELSGQISRLLSRSAQANQSSFKAPSAPLTDQEMKKKVRYAIDTMSYRELMEQFSSVSLPKIFNICELSQRDLLSISKLICRELDKDTLVKLAVLQECLVRLNPLNDTIVHHVPILLLSVLERLEAFAMSLQNDGSHTLLGEVTSIVQSVANILEVNNNK